MRNSKMCVRISRGLFQRRCCGGGRGYGFGEAAVNSMAQACFWPTRLVPAALSSPFMAVCVSFFPARQLFTFGLF